ncbi:fibrobacter succinogenes major paralogous domain-containing protein [Patescibacteria group bacterium]|nr:fibrobacter succinogenes major paralogous domain-containing protein [Patescibacteria group bacterium]
MNKKMIIVTKDEEKYLELDDHNLHVNSSKWTEIVVKGEKQLVNPERDGWEITKGEARGEQVFFWEGAMREARKAGKIIPSDRRLNELLKTKSDMPNLVFAGYRNKDGTIRNQGKFAYLWTSTEDSDVAWNQCLSSRDDLTDRGTHGKKHGFSVRCLKKK